MFLLLFPNPTTVVFNPGCTWESSWKLFKKYEYHTLGPHPDQHIPNLHTCAKTQGSQGPGRCSPPFFCRRGQLIQSSYQCPNVCLYSNLFFFFFELQTLYSAAFSTLSPMCHRDLNLMFSCHIPRHGTFCCPPSPLLLRSQPWGLP